MKIPKFIKDLISKPDPPIEYCKCGVVGTHGFIGKDKSLFSECDVCFQKRIRKTALKCIRQAIHARGWDICPECRQRGKPGPAKMKQRFRFYKCPNGHEWELIDKVKE
jgi:hypothetical protein